MRWATWEAARAPRSTHRSTKVWAVVEDVLDAPNWQGGLEDMEALEKDADGRPTLVEAENDIKVRRVKTHVRFAYDGPERLSWTQEKGDLKSVEGSWVLEDLGDGRTRATYNLDADPGRHDRHADPRPGRGRGPLDARQLAAGRAEEARRRRVARYASSENGG